MKALSGHRPELSITGGITPKRDLPLFRNINVSTYRRTCVCWRCRPSGAGRSRLNAPKLTLSGEKSMRNHPLGIYEKALAKDLSWPERLSVLAKLSVVLILSRCRWWTKRMNAFRARVDASPTRTLVSAMLESGVAIPSMCPLRSSSIPFWQLRDEAVRERAREIGDQSYSPRARP